MPTATRRKFLMGCASIAAMATLFPQSAVADETVTVDQFVTLSARLTAAAASDLESAMANKLLAGFLANGRAPGLVLLSSDTKVNTGTVADDIVAAWYSGVYDTPSGKAVAGFTGALMWNALDFTKPLGFCGGETGYWAEPPQS